MHGIRYIVVALGGPDEQPTEEETQFVADYMNERLPFQTTVLSERVSNKVTLALLQEEGVL